MTDVPNVTGRPSASPGSTPSSLLRGLKAADPGAWKRLAALYAEMVYGWCRARGLQTADAEDVVQEVFFTVHARIGEFRHNRPGATFRGWLWSITFNKLGDHFRRSAKAGVVGLQADEPAPAGTPPPGTAGLYRKAIEQVRGEFTALTWQAFWRVVVEDQPPASVADELGVSVNAVYLAKSRVLRRLREEIGEA